MKKRRKRNGGFTARELVKEAASGRDEQRGGGEEEEDEEAKDHHHRPNARSSRRLRSTNTQHPRFEPFTCRENIPPCGQTAGGKRGREWEMYSPRGSKRFSVQNRDACGSVHPLAAKLRVPSALRVAAGG